MTMECREVLQQKKVLLALDFDHTIVNDNSDIAVTKLAPGGKIPREIEALYTDNGWTKYMGEIFRHLHENQTTPQQILDLMKKIEFSPGMVELLKGVDRNKTEIIIISDANSVFINHILDHHNMQDVISRVYTNPAQFNKNGLLQIEMYHFQESCSLSTVNLCKGQILDAYVKERASQDIHFSHIAYIGDGQNDFCPSLRLSESDFVFPRHGYSLVKYIEKMKNEKDLHIKANIHVWKSGLEILEILHENIPFLKMNH